MGEKESGKKGQRWRKRNKVEGKENQKGEEKEEEEEEKEEERHPSLSLANHYQCYSQN